MRCVWYKIIISCYLAMVVIVDQFGHSSAEAGYAALLSPEALSKRWDEIGASVSQLLSWMVSQEKWLKEGGDGELQAVLIQLVQLSESPAAAQQLHRPEIAGHIGQLLSWVDASRFFGALEVMDRNMPNFVNRFVLALGNVGGEANVVAANLFFERVLVAQKAGLLDQVFGVRTHQIAETIRAIQEINNA